MPWILPLIQIIGTALGAYGTYQQGVATAARNKYQARVAKYNAQAAEQEAQFAEQAAAKKAGQQKQKARAVASAQKAAQGASGFVAGSGSFGDILEDTALVGQLDAEAIKHEGALAAYRSREQSKLYSASGQLYDNAAGTASFNAALNSGATLLSGLSTVDYGKFTKKKG